MIPIRLPPQVKASFVDWPFDLLSDFRIMPLIYLKIYGSKRFEPRLPRLVCCFSTLESSLELSKAPSMDLDSVNIARASAISIGPCWQSFFFSKPYLVPISVAGLREQL